MAGKISKKSAKAVTKEQAAEERGAKRNGTQLGQAIEVFNSRPQALEEANALHTRQEQIYAEGDALEELGPDADDSPPKEWAAKVKGKPKLKKSKPVQKSSPHPIDNKISLGISIKQINKIVDKADELRKSLPDSDNIQGGMIILTKAAEALRKLSLYLGALEEPYISPTILENIKTEIEKLFTSVNADVRNIQDNKLRPFHAQVCNFYSELPENLKAGGLKKISPFSLGE